MEVYVCPHFLSWYNYSVHWDVEYGFIVSRETVSIEKPTAVEKHTQDSEASII
jgi:hypothetical protein